MLVSSFNLSQSFSYTPNLFYKKTVQFRDLFFLYMDPVVCFMEFLCAVTSKKASLIFQLPPEFYSCGKDAVPGPDVPIRCQKSLFLFKKEIQIAAGRGHTDEKDELFSY